MGAAGQASRRDRHDVGAPDGLPGEGIDQPAVDGDGAGDSRQDRVDPGSLDRGEQLRVLRLGARGVGGEPCVEPLSVLRRCGGEVGQARTEDDGPTQRGNGQDRAHEG